MTKKVTEGIYWVGITDWSVRNFHGYVTNRGSTYNAYLVKGAKNALIDTVKAPFAKDYLANVAELLPAEKIDYIVCNHAEPDHSSSLPAAMAAFKGATLVCNAKCKDALEHYYDTKAWKFQVVKDSETLSLGNNKTLQFFDTPMVHWPESMATYVQEDGLLFSMDAFGQHYACSERFDDEADMNVVMQEAKTYYANIVALYGMPVAATLKRLGGLRLNIVCPSHGIIWRKHFAQILAAYQKWMLCKPAKKVLVLYCTMWHSTEQMAQAVAEGAETLPVDVKLINVDAMNDTRIVTEALDCAAIAVGSPTLNIGLMPRMAATLTYLRGLKPLTGKASFAFGSYGWASKGAEEAAAYLEAMRTAPVALTLHCRFAPDAATLQACKDAGRKLAEIAMKA